MPLIELSPNDIQTEAQLPSARMKILVLMLWPEDEAFRRSIALSFLQDAMEAFAVKKNSRVTLDADFLKLRGKRVDAADAIDIATELAVEGSQKANKSRTPFQRTKGTIAGEILLHAFDLQDKGETDIGLNRCLKLESDVLANSMRARPEDIRGHWHAYKSVAHLWAAHIILDHNGFSAETMQKFCIFLLLAELFRSRGLGIGDRRAVGKLLDQQTAWQLSAEVCQAIVSANPNLAQNFGS